MSEPTVQVSQCPAVNDGMEGVRCHGDIGHTELHWADVSGDGDVTEWGDTEELWDEIDRLRALLPQPTPPAEPNREPCTAETYSWDHFRSTQVDPYWIRCTEVGQHEQHSDSNTGLTWQGPSTIRDVVPPVAP